MRRLELQIFFWITRAVFLFLLPIFISDISGYLEKGNQFAESGQLPYRDFGYEYPPLAYLLVAIPALFNKVLGLTELWHYRVLFGIAVLPFDYLLFRAFLRRPPFRGAAFYYVLFTCFLAHLIYDRFDLVVGFLVAAPFLSGTFGGEEREDRKFAWFWGLGGALKLVPLSLIPFQIARSNDWRRVLRFGILASVPIAVSLAGTLYLAKGKIPFLSYHSERGVQIETFLGSSLLAGKVLFQLLPEVSIVQNHGAHHLAGAGWLKPLGSSIFLSVFFASFLISFALLRMGRLSTLAAAWILQLTFVTFGYVLSPQFLLWLVPLALLITAEVPSPWKVVWVGLFGLVVGLTGLHFLYYWDYVNLKAVNVTWVLLRNLGLFLLWGLSWLLFTLPKPMSDDRTGQLAE